MFEIRLTLKSPRQSTSQTKAGAALSVSGRLAGYFVTTVNQTEQTDPGSHWWIFRHVPRVTCDLTGINKVNTKVKGILGTKYPLKFANIS